MSPRTRSRGEFVLPSSPRYNWKNNTSCAQTSWAIDGTISNSVKSGVVETMTDYVVPRFASRSRHGEVFFNSMSQVKTTSDEGTGVGVWHQYTANSCNSPVRHAEYRHIDNTFPGYLFPGNVPIPVGSAISYSDIADLQTEVSTRCLAQRGYPDSNLFESIAEMNQTLNMLNGPIARLNALLSKNSSKIMRISPASAWLGYRYGVMPLVRDISNISQGLAKRIGTQRVTTRARGSLSRYAASGGEYANAVHRTQWISQTSHSVECRAMSLDEYYVGLAENIGFTGKGLLTLPWELIPYSFVADWFGNIGDFLNALVPLPSLKQLGSCLVTTETKSTVYNSTGTQPVAATTIIRPWISTFSATQISKTRVGLSAPGVVVRADFKLDNAIRQADALALLAQRASLLFGRRR